MKGVYVYSRETYPLLDEKGGLGINSKVVFFLGGRGEEGKRKDVPRDSFDVFSFGAPRPMYLITLVILFPAERH